MGANQSLIMYFADAGMVVKTVMMLLVIASLMSWTVIVQRWMFLNAAQKQLRLFEQQFWSGTDLSQLYSTLERQSPTGLASIFYAGFSEFLRSKKETAPDQRSMLEGVQRAMRIAYAREVDKLEVHLSFLASVGSISPYVGLFGTVWGIMSCLHALGSAQQATIAMVAPGISEALIATAMGLFAAIPAVLAYNRHSNVVDRVIQAYETFQEEFTNIIYRQA